MKKSLDLSCRRWIAFSICVIAGNGFRLLLIIYRLQTIASTCYREISYKQYFYVQRPNKSISWIIYIMQIMSKFSNKRTIGEKNVLESLKTLKGVTLITTLSVQLCSNSSLCGSSDQFHENESSTTYPTSEPNLNSTENPSVSSSVKPTSSLTSSTHSSTLPTSTTTTTIFYVDPNCP